MERTKDELAVRLESLRSRLERAFRPDTAAAGFTGHTRSAGHCAAVAAILHEIMGGQMVSTVVEGQSHWLNRLSVDDEQVDVDLTGDQFSRPPLQIGPPNLLYDGLRVRGVDELNDETLERARLLAERAEFADVARAIEDRLRRRKKSV